MGARLPPLDHMVGTSPAEGVHEFGAGLHEWRLKLITGLLFRINPSSYGNIGVSDRRISFIAFTARVANIPGLRALKRGRVSANHLYGFEKFIVQNEGTH